MDGFLDDEEIVGDNVAKFQKALDEFDTYIEGNKELIPNYGEFWRNEETIAMRFVESMVNQIVSKRFAKLQADAVDEEERTLCFKRAPKCSTAIY